jgi:FixJ family two-component response regulator/DNA-binding MarR family transcriptional regulator
MLEGNIQSAQRMALYVLLVDSDRTALLEQAEAVQSMGHYCLTASSSDEAVQLFSSRPEINLVICDATLSGETGLDLVGKLGESCQNGRSFLSILLTASPSVELAVQAMQHGVIDFLSKPIARDKFSAAIERAALRLVASGPSGTTARVEESIAHIQTSLSALMDKLGVSQRDETDSDEDVAAAMANPNAIHPSVLKAIIKARRNRQKYFEGDLFSDPSWDILLELTAAHIENRQESVTSVAIAASVPASTAIRKIRELADRGLVRRWTDPADARRIFVALTDDATRRMLAMLGSVENAPII